jgi:hypothetical protein
VQAKGKEALAIKPVLDGNAAIPPDDGAQMRGAPEGVNARTRSLYCRKTG